jgi:hypothetical protein
LEPNISCLFIRVIKIMWYKMCLNLTYFLNFNTIITLKAAEKPKLIITVFKTEICCKKILLSSIASIEAILPQLDFKEVREEICSYETFCAKR